MQQQRSYSVIGYSVWLSCSLILALLCNHLLVDPLYPALVSNWLFPHFILGALSYAAVIAGLVVSITCSFNSKEMPKTVFYLQTYATVLFSACTITGYVWSLSAWGGPFFMPAVLKAIYSGVLVLIMIVCTVVLAKKRGIEKALAVFSFELAFILCIIIVDYVHNGAHIDYLDVKPGLQMRASDGNIINALNSLLIPLTVCIVVGLIPALIMNQKSNKNYISWWIYGAALPVVAVPHAILMKSEQPSPHIQASIFCTQCGIKNPAVAKFCKSCGSPME